MDQSFSTIYAISWKEKPRPPKEKMVKSNGADGFISPPKEVVLWIGMVMKIRDS
jgi:hypothetical protein